MHFVYTIESYVIIAVYSIQSIGYKMWHTVQKIKAANNLLSQKMVFHFQGMVWRVSW